MKTLLCLRHAHALQTSATGDHNRHLSPQGQNDATALGQLMAEKNYIPQQVLCSTAMRTRMTWDALSTALPQCDITFEDILYSGTMEDYIDLIKETPDTIDSLLVIGHNPTIHTLAANLGNTQSPLLTHYPPCTLSVFEIQTDRWSRIKPGVNTVVDVVGAD